MAPEARPLERVLGPELGDMIRQIHEEQGVVFHLGRGRGVESGRVSWTTARRCRPICSWPASVCGPIWSWPREPAWPSTADCW